MKQLLRRFRASWREAQSISREMWMRPEVPQSMCERQGRILMRWDSLQQMGGRAV